MAAAFSAWGEDWVAHADKAEALTKTPESTVPPGKMYRVVSTPPAVNGQEPRAEDLLKPMPLTVDGDLACVELRGQKAQQLGELTPGVSLRGSDP